MNEVNRGASFTLLLLFFGFIPNDLKLVFNLDLLISEACYITSLSLISWISALYVFNFLMLVLKGTVSTVSSVIGLCLVSEW